MNVEAFLMSNKIFHRDLWWISSGQKLTHNEDEKTTAVSTLKGIANAIKFYDERKLHSIRFWII